MIVFLCFVCLVPVHQSRTCTSFLLKQHDPEAVESSLSLTSETSQPVEAEEEDQSRDIKLNLSNELVLLSACDSVTHSSPVLVLPLQQADQVI